MERILSENIVDLQEAEAGFDGIGGGTTPPGSEGDTNTTDIAQTAPLIKIARTAISLSLPAMIGYNQPLQGPSGFVFGLVQRDETQISSLDANSEQDEVITRKLVDTKIRSVELKMTTEAATDIQQLFGTEFKENFSAFQKSGGEVWNGPNKSLASFFLNTGMRRVADKINFDFVEWLLQISTRKGTVDITTYAESTNIFGAIGELREGLFKATGKSGQPWILVSPRIAAFISSTIGSTMSSGAEAFDDGRRIPSDKQNGYVLTMGDIDVFQYDFSKLPQPNTIPPKVTGGMTPETYSESRGQIIMGYQGSEADSASIYYCPYKEYLVQTEDYQTGEPTVWYKVRDAFVTNPLDTYDDSQVEPEIISTVDNTSSFVMSCEVEFAESIIKP